MQLAAFSRRTAVGGCVLMALGALLGLYEVSIFVSAWVQKRQGTAPLDAEDGVMPEPVEDV